MLSSFWDDKRAPGVKNTIDLSQYETVLDVFHESLKQYADRPAYTNVGVTITYRQLDEMSGHFASYLQNHTDLKPGDRIAIQMPNLLQFPIAVFGAMRAGLIVVNTNPLYTEREMLHQFIDAGVRAIVYFNTFGRSVENVRAKTNIKYFIGTSLGEMQTSIFKRFLVNFAVKHIKKMVAPYHIAEEISFREVLKKGAEKPYKPVPAKAEDVAILQYTGGTTGVAKGAELTNRNLVANMLQVKSLFGQLGDDGKPLLDDALVKDGYAVCPLPLYHIFAFTAHCMCLTSMGIHNLLITNPRDTNMVMRILKGKKLIGITGVNTLYVAFMDNPKFKESVATKDLRLCVSGGTALASGTAIRWKEMTGADITEGYGLTECSPIVSVNPVGKKARQGTIGMPAPGTDVMLVDDDGNEVTDVGVPGELCVRGPQVMKGYWKRPDETRKTFTEDGQWLKTGDVAVLEADGFLKIVDRKKDLVLVSGFNVYPNEIEDVVSKHPKVANCAVIGVPDDKTGEAVKLFIQARDKSLTAEEVKAFIEDKLTGYKRPKYIVFRDELPMTPVGKILRRELRDLKD